MKFRNECESGRVDAQLSLFAAGVSAGVCIPLRPRPTLQVSTTLAPSAALYQIAEMPSETAKGWATRLNNVKFLFNNEKFALAEREARSLLDEPMLPPYYRIQCLVVLAQCLEEWHQAKVSILSHCQV
jgi:hypothetical protein